MKRAACALLCAALLLLLPVDASSEAGVWRVVRNVRLLTEPSSTTGHRIKTLHREDVVAETGEEPSGDYIHVQDDAGDVGWVYQPYLTETAEAEDLHVTPEHGEATSISSDWVKPAPNTTQFVNAEGVHCGPTGNGDEVDTNRRKNRTDVPTEYHAVTWAAIDRLDYPVAPKHRTDWSAEQLGEIQPFEGAAVTVTGYLAALKPQAGNEEDCNCRMTREAETDWHLSLVEHEGDGEKDGFVVETTPRVRRDHPMWTKARLLQWVDTDQPVRISGWLMLDPEHRNHLGSFRNTLWEVHPITRIEVMNNGAWADLDLLQ